MSAPDVIAPEDFSLTPAERVGTVWPKIERWLKQRIEDLRTENEKDLDDKHTARLRAEIKALRGLLALGEELPPSHDGM